MEFASQESDHRCPQPRGTPSQGCSSGSGHYTPSVKAALQRAEILVVDTKLGRDPITDPGWWPLWAGSPASPDQQRSDVIWGGSRLARASSCRRLYTCFSLSTLPGRRPFEVGRNMADDDEERKYVPSLLGKGSKLPLKVGGGGRTRSFKLWW